jgi:cardiolipin synthase A/B
MWATIGSTNLDTRSFVLNDEVNAVVYHNQVVGQLEKVFADDLMYSRKIDLEEWRNRNLKDHMLEVLSIPVRPQL